ncbi:MAG: DUF393 domain-containing protein [bacterium]
MTPRALVLYDGECRFCRASVARLRTLDWLGRLDYADARDPAVLAAHPRVDPVRAIARLQLVPPDGSDVREGFFALRWMALRLPPLWPLWPFLWLPGAAALGVRAYDTVARNRFVFGTCDDGACELPGETQPVTRKSGNPAGGPSRT